MTQIEQIRSAPCELELNEKFRCKCGSVQPKVGGPWVAAHWDDELFHECQDCGQRFSIKSGRVRLVEAKGATR